MKEISGKDIILKILLDILALAGVLLENSIPISSKLFIVALPFIGNCYRKIEESENIIKIEYIYIFLTYFIISAHGEFFLRNMIIILVYCIILHFIISNTDRGLINILLLFVLQMGIYILFINLNINYTFLIVHIIGFLFFNILFNRYTNKE